MHERYGPIVRVSPNEVSFISCQAWTDIYGTDRNFTKDITFYGRRPLGGAESLVTELDRRVHTKIRRAWNPAFTEKSLREQEPLIGEYAEMMVWRMGMDGKKKLVTTYEEPLSDEGEKTAIDDEGGDGKINLVDVFQFATFDTTADLTFGEPMQLLKEGRYSWWVSTIFETLRLAAISGVIMKVLYPFDKYILRSLMVPFKGKVIKHHQYSKALTDRRLARGSQGKKDFYSYVLDKEGKSKDLDIRDLYASSVTFIMAGSETSASALCGLFYYMLKDEQGRERYEKLVKEVRSTFKRSEDVNLLAMAKMEYLNACLKEAMRLYPPVPGGLPRVVPQGGAAVCGIWIPGGVSILIDCFPG
jgi:cytochrome P450